MKFLPWWISVFLSVFPIWAQNLISVQVEFELTQKVVNAQGEVVSDDYARMEYIRNTDGSIYQKQQQIDRATGDIEDSIIHVFKISTGVQYIIHPQSKRAMIVQGRPSPVIEHQSPPSLPRGDFLDRTVIIMPLMSGNYGKIGEVWKDEETGALLYKYSKRELSDGSIQIRETKATGVVTGIKPNQESFKIPEGYEIVESLW